MLRVFFPGHFNILRPSYTCYHLCRSMAGADFPVQISAPSFLRTGETRLLKPILPRPIGRMLGKLDRRLVAKWSEARFIKLIHDADAVYVWGRVSTNFVEALKETGVPVYREKINGLTAAAKEILDGVYERLGKQPAHNATDDIIAAEKLQLSMVDYIFVANPSAADQYGRFGVDTKKIIRSSYGWEQERFTGLPAKSADAPLTVLFVGVADIRKGANLLLQAWARSGIKGRLVFGGPVAQEIVDDHADLLARPDVVVTGWRNDIEQIYASADIFAFPSHEEGGPVVTYEAMGCGLPVVVSPIGAGAIARDGKDGFVVDPFDVEGWIHALRRLAADAELRRFMGETAKERAQDFTWAKVGARRRQAIVERTV
jgi:glycosyltransferase involved in cell wall biosynthesis